MPTPNNDPQLNPDMLQGVFSPTMTPTEDGGMDIEFPNEDTSDQQEPNEFSEESHMDNLVDQLSDDDLKIIANKVIDGYKADVISREEWMRTLMKGMDMLGTKLEEGTVFKGACGVNHPLITEAAIKFQQKASLEILPAGGPVEVQILGDPTPEAEEQASRVKAYMNWQTTTQMPDYYPDSEKMLFYLSLVGGGFKKMYYSERFKRCDTNFLPIDQFVVPYGAKSLEKANRYTEVIYYTESDLKREIAAGLYSDTAKIGEPSQVQLSDFQQKQDMLIGVGPSPSAGDRVYTVLEQHVDLSLPGIDDEPDFDKPYIVSVDQASGQVLSIYRNWRYGDDTYTKKMWYVHYQFVPGLGFYGLGYIHLLGNMQWTLTTALRALIDAGQFSNLPAGFVKKGVRIRDNNKEPLAPGEFREIEGALDDLRQAFVPLPFKGPDQTLFALVQYLEDRALKFADSTEQVVQDSSNYGPVGTTMALLDASTKFFTAVHKRLHFAQKKELGILAELNQYYLDDRVEYKMPGQTLVVMQSDFNSDVLSIVPVSDPNISSQAQRVALAQAKLQFIQTLPPDLAGRINRDPIVKSILIGLGEENIDQIMQPQAQPIPQDPFSDILDVTKGKQIQAFPGQDHDAHLMFKTAWINDPTQGGNPMFQGLLPIIQANMQQHAVMKFQEQMLGVIKQQNPDLEQQIANNEMGQGQAPQQQQPANMPGVTGAATDPKTLDMIVAKAAQQVSQVNAEIAARGQTQTPEGMVAQAEVQKADNQKKQIALSAIKDSAKLSLEQQKLQLDAAKEMNRKQEAQQGLKQKHAHKSMDVGSDMANQAMNRLNDLAKEKAKAKFMKEDKLSPSDE